MLSDGFFDKNKPCWVRWGDLPHWRQDGATYFVTFRLADSLPEEKLAILRDEREKWRRENRAPTSDQLEEFSLAHRSRVERWLDQGSGSCVLAMPQVARIVEEAIRFFDGTRYEIGENTVAPNHVHVVTRTAMGIDLSDVLKSWKGYTSREIRKIVRWPQPHLWQTESFDHIVRNSLSLESISDYIRGHKM